MVPRRSLLDFDGRRLQGVRPFAQFEISAGGWTYTPLPTTNESSQSGQGDALQALQKLLEQARQSCGAAGAAIGYFSYDFARQLEPIAFQQTQFQHKHQSPAYTSSETARHNAIGSNASGDGLPDACLVFYENLAIGPQPLLKTGQDQNVTQKSLAIPMPDDYREAVGCIKRYIEDGDIYQANLIRHFERPLTESPGELYEKLSRRHPARFAAYLEWDDFVIVSNSPERFLKLEDRTLTAEPIKGTIRRGSDSVEDESLIQTLQRSLKDRAENVMIVDLLRNDLGRVCEWGSVQVPELWKVQTLPTLHHLVSTVTGTLRADLHAVDAFRAAFPCGSITGAPKIRAMQIIEELEPIRRGVSMGAIGYFGFDGAMDWNVAIRTVTCRDGKASFHTGGGLVADSVAELEWQELQLKASALLAALAPDGVVPSA